MSLNTGVIWVRFVTANVPKTRSNQMLNSALPTTLSVTAAEVTVPTDTAVELELVSTDVVHTWNVEELAGKADAVPGKTNDVLFITDDEGVFEGESATLSGQAYASMRTAVEVVSPEEYEEFIETRKEEIETAQDRVVELIEEGETP